MRDGLVQVRSVRFGQNLAGFSAAAPLATRISPFKLGADAIIHSVRLSSACINYGALLDPVEVKFGVVGPEETIRLIDLSDIYLAHHYLGDYNASAVGLQYIQHQQTNHIDFSFPFKPILKSDQQLGFYVSCGGIGTSQILNATVSVTWSLLKSIGKHENAACPI